MIDYKELLKGIRVKQFEGMNHFVISGNGFEALQSYSSLVVLRVNGEVILGYDWDYSRTTIKYVGHFLGCNADEIRKRIKDGTYKYDENMR